MIASGGGEPPTPPTPTILPVFYDNLNFDGVAYIETDLLLPQDGSVLISCYFGTTESRKPQRIFDVGGLIGAVLDSRTDSQARYESFFYGDTTATQLSTKLYWNSGASLELFLTPNYGGFGSFKTNITKGANIPNSPLVIGQNTISPEQALAGTLRKCRIYDSSAQNVSNTSGFSSYTPVYTLVPCTYDGEPGLWCEEENKFYGNSNSTGTLTVSNNE